MPVFVPERKRNVRGERRLASLLDAADQVFGKLGYHGATTNIIAAEAKVSPATLYRSFPNKDAIADELVTRYAIDLEEEVRAADIQELVSAPLPHLRASGRRNKPPAQVHGHTTDAARAPCRSPRAAR